MLRILLDIPTSKKQSERTTAVLGPCGTLVRTGMVCSELCANQEAKEIQMETTWVRLCLAHSKALISNTSALKLWY